MNATLKNTIRWGKFNAILGMVTSAFSILSVVGAPFGVLSLLGFIKLNTATDTLKNLTLKEDPSPKEYEEILVTYGEYHKWLGIAQIAQIVLSIMAIFFWIVVVVALMRYYNGPTMMRGYYY